MKVNSLSFHLWLSHLHLSLYAIQIIINKNNRLTEFLSVKTESQTLLSYMNYSLVNLHGCSDVVEYKQKGLHYLALYLF